MTDATNTVVLDEDGLPEGVLDHPAEPRPSSHKLVEDGILLITLERPSRLNAFDERMIREMRSVIWKANFDDAIRVIVITGSGRAFCAGRDLNGLDYENNLSTPQYRADVRANPELFA